MKSHHSSFSGEKNLLNLQKRPTNLIDLHGAVADYHGPFEFHPFFDRFDFKTVFC